MLNVHPFTNCLKKIKKCFPFICLCFAPSISIYPFNRKKYEGGKYKKKIIVFNFIKSMNPVHMLNSKPASFTIIPVLHKFCNQQGGVIISFLAVFPEFPGAM